jgi:hypothetical protein
MNEGEVAATTVLYLDADDEITSAAARIRGAEADRIGVVLPYGSRLATSRINFRLLAREATERGKTIEIVAADASARALALTAGLTVHPSVSAFEGGETPLAGDASASATATTAGAAPSADDAPTSAILVPRSKATQVPVVGRARPLVRPRLAVGTAVAIVALLAVGGVLAYTQLPSATIVLSPWSSPIGPLSASVLADPKATAPDAATLTVPAQRFTFDLSVQQTFEATGVKVTDVAATGTVRFSSVDTGRSNTIAADSIVKSESGIEFRTLAEVTLPPATISFDGSQFILVPSVKLVGVEAVVAGPSGNVKDHTIIVVPPSENEKRTFVTNPEATTGGAHNESPEISQEDVDGAVATLTAALPAELDRQVGLAGSVPPGTTLYPQTKTIGKATPTGDPASLVGKDQATFDLGLDAQGTVLGIDSGPVRTLAEARLRTQLQPDWSLDEPSISIVVGAPEIVGQVVTFPVTMSARQIRTLNQAALLAQIEGLDLPAARARLDDFGDADIRLWPDWVTTIPTNAGRVSLTIGDPAPLPSATP